MKLFILLNFLFLFCLCSLSRAGFEVGNGGDTTGTDEITPVDRVITCQSLDSAANNKTEIEIYKEEGKNFVSAMININGIWKTLRGTLEKSQEYRDCCPPNHPASCGCDMILINVTHVKLEDGSFVRIEFLPSSNKGTGYLKALNNIIQLSCNDLLNKRYLSL